MEKQTNQTKIKKSEENRRQRRKGFIFEYLDKLLNISRYDLWNKTSLRFISAE